MDKFIAKLLKDFENGKLSRRQLVETIEVAAVTFAAGEATAHAAPASGFRTIAVNHISYSCPDYTIARDFYQHVMGMSVVADSGRQCYMPFGQSNTVTAGTHLLPRGYPTAPASYTTSGAITAPAAPRGGGAAAAAGNRGAAAGAAAGAGARGAAPGAAPAAGARGGAGAQQVRPQNQVTIDHIAYTCKNWDRARVKAILETWGLYPTEDQDSFHVKDPFGYDLQISGPGMTGYPETNKPNGVK